MNLQRKFLHILIIMLAGIILAACSPVSAYPLAMLTPFPEIKILQQGSSVTETTSPDWIAIDPIPVIDPNENFTISGNTSLPDSEYVNVHIQLLFSSPEARSANHTSYNMYAMTLPWSKEGRQVWSVENDAQGYQPDQCTVEVKAVKKGVYTTAVSPSPFPQVSDPDTPYWIRISPGGTHDLNENFTLTGQTNLPAGYPLVMEIYPGVFSLDKFSFDVDYDPMVREIIPVRLDDDGISVFSLPVNLTERSAQTGRELTLGSYFTEVHAVNMNSTVSDQGIFQATTTGPWVAIDPFPEPVQGTNLTISGRTNLSAGSNVVVSIDTLMHPCFKCSSPESNPGSYCCGACETPYISEEVPAENLTAEERSWKIEVPTTNWCTHEKYYVEASTGTEENAHGDYRYFSIQAA